MIIEQHITVTSAEQEPVTVLANASGLSKAKVKQLMQRGGVWLSRGRQTQRLRRAKRTLQVGDELHLYFNQQVFEQKPNPAQLIADEQWYSVWYKPYGMWSQGSKWGDHCSIARWAEQHLEPQRNAFIVHRLDRAASGLIMLAHSKQAAASLSALFAQRSIRKRYRVVVNGCFGELGQRRSFDDAIDDKPARSHGVCIAYDQSRDCSLVDVDIETGRKHQIRKHMAGAGHPIMGDRQYGDADKPLDKDLQLTAIELAFDCPFTQQPKCYTLGDELRPSL